MGVEWKDHILGLEVQGQQRLHRERGWEKGTGPLCRRRPRSGGSRAAPWRHLGTRRT